MKPLLDGGTYPPKTVSQACRPPSGKVGGVVDSTGGGDWMADSVSFSAEWDPDIERRPSSLEVRAAAASLDEVMTSSTLSGCIIMGRKMATYAYTHARSIDA